MSAPERVNSEPPGNPLIRTHEEQDGRYQHDGWQHSRRIRGKRTDCQLALAFERVFRCIVADIDEGRKAEGRNLTVASRDRDGQKSNPTGDWQQEARLTGLAGRVATTCGGTAREPSLRVDIRRRCGDEHEGQE